MWVIVYMERFFCVLRFRKFIGLLRVWGMFFGRVFGGRELIVFFVVILVIVRYFFIASEGLVEVWEVIILCGVVR